MENKFYKLSEDCDWSNYTFIFPGVSIGNIGQLAIDLLISSLPNTHKAGYVTTDLVQPIVGHDPFVQNSTELSLSCERNFIIFLDMLFYAAFLLFINSFYKIFRHKIFNSK